MKIIKYLTVIFLCILLSGCITTKKVKKERVDQKADGNFGYVDGKVPKGQLKEIKSKEDKREYYKVNVTLPPFPELRERYWKDDKIWGNKGYIMGGPQKSKK